jgi:hypothetical protein
VTSALVTQRNWARSLGISTDTFRRWREAGLIPVPLDLPGHPRWDAAVVARVTATIRKAGTSRYFRTAALCRRQGALQSRPSRLQQRQGTQHGPLVSQQRLGDVHAVSVGASSAPSPLYSLEAK